MKFQELVTEAKMDPEIKDVLIDKGYKFLGHGQDQDAYLAPDGTILKIFGWDEDRSDHGLSRAQQSFVDFATYCQHHSDNEFLPDFGGWEMFEFNGKTYLQIKCERLFEAEDEIEWITGELEGLGELINHVGLKKAMKEFLDNHDKDNWRRVGETITLLGGKKHFKLMAKTIDDLVQLGKSKGYTWDLHAGNFMLGSDGTLVINDPFFTGSWRDHEDFDDWNTLDPSGGDELSWGNGDDVLPDDSEDAEKSDKKQPGSLTKALDKLFKS